MVLATFSNFPARKRLRGFFTPLVIFAVFFLVQLILPGKWVPGYVINPETGEPRN